MTPLIRRLTAQAAACWRPGVDLTTLFTSVGFRRDGQQMDFLRRLDFLCLVVNPTTRHIQQVETFLRAMFLFQGLQQLLVTLTHQPPPAPVWTPGRGPVDGIVEDGEAQVLEVDPDLVCSASQRATADHAGFSIEAQPLEDGSAILSLRIDTADANFKGNDQDGLLGDQLPFWKLTLHSAHVLLFKLLESTNVKKKKKTFETAMAKALLMHYGKRTTKAEEYYH